MPNPDSFEGQRPRATPETKPPSTEDLARSTKSEPDLIEGPAAAGRSRWDPDIPAGNDATASFDPARYASTTSPPRPRSCPPQFSGGDDRIGVRRTISHASRRSDRTSSWIMSYPGKLTATFRGSTVEDQAAIASPRRARFGGPRRRSSSSETSQGLASFCPHSPTMGRDRTHSRLNAKPSTSLEIAPRSGELRCRSRVLPRPTANHHCHAHTSIPR
jgi:hypothetical protein